MRLKELIVPTIILFILFIFICPTDGFFWDLDIFHLWANQIGSWGIGNVYYSNSDYTPLYFYILKLNYMIFGNQSNPDFNHHIKIYTIFIELIGVLVVLHSVKDKGRLLLHWSLLALNFAYLYESLIWGQVDGIGVTLNFSAIYLAYRKNWTAAFCLFVLSVNFKIQSIMFLPLFGLMFINDLKNLTSKKILLSVFTALLLQVIVLIPFLHIGKLKQIANVLTSAVGRYPVVSMNAANIWHLIFPNEYLLEKSDMLLFLNISLRKWGLIMMSVVLLIVFYPALKKTIQNLLGKIKTAIDFNSVMLLGALTPLVFFFFNTEMHERYSHNAFLFIAAWCFNTKNYLPLIVFSFAFFLNVDIVMCAVTNKPFHWSFQFIAALFGLLTVYLIAQIYSKWNSEKLPAVSQ